MSTPVHAPRAPTRRARTNVIPPVPHPTSRTRVATFGPDGQPRIDRKKLAAKADDLDARIKQLARMRDGLRHAAACRAPSHMECPTFQRLLHAVTSGVIAPGARRRKGG